MCLLVSDQCADTLFSPLPKGIPILHSYLLQPRLHATFETLTPFWKYFLVSELYSNAFPCFLHRILCQILICLLTWSLSLPHSRINIRRKRIWSYLFMFISPNIVSFLEQMAHVYLLNKNTYAFQSQKKCTHIHIHTQLWEMSWSLNTVLEDPTAFYTLWSSQFTQISQPCLMSPYDSEFQSF